MLNFKEWFILNENEQEKALALQLAGSQENYNELEKVLPEKQKNTLLLLAAYYLSQSKNLTRTKKDIQDYIQLLKNNKMPLIKVNLNTKKPDAPFDSYIYWTEIIHGHQGEEQAKQAKKYTPTDLDFQNEKPIAASPDGLIKVYQANSPNQCIILGKGEKFCISQPGNTMWKTYRDDKTSSFYFVYDHSRNDNLSIVVVDANENGLELTDKINKTGTAQNPYNPQQRNTDPQIYMNYLKSKGINTNIFQNLPKTQEEDEEDKKLGRENKDLKWFISLSPKEKSSYIGRGHRLSDEQFNYIWNNKFYSLLEQYAKTGLQLNDYQIDKIATDKDLIKNYIHNRIIAHNNENQESIRLNRKEYSLLSQQQQEKLYEDLSDASKLTIAIYFGDLNLVKQLVEKGVEISDSSVGQAIRDDDFNLLKYLVEKNAPIPDRTVAEAIYYNGNFDIVKYLVEKGAPLEAAVTNAALIGNLDIVKYLIEKGAKIPADIIGTAAGSGNFNLVKYLLSNGAEIDNKAVSSAVSKGNVDFVKYLLSKGAKIDDAAVQVAMAHKNLEMANYLIDQGAIINSQAIDYAIDIAKKDNSFTFVEYLLEKGGPITSKLIEYAIRNNKLDIIKHFIEKGSKISNDASKAAIYMNDLNLLKYLVAKGGKIPSEIDYAVANGYFDIVKYLVEKGVKIPLYSIGTAKTNGKDDIADYLKSKLQQINK